jgi:hypothetical protein
LQPPPHKLSPFNEHIEHDFPDDPFDKLISSIPSHSRIFSSPCHSTQIIKGKTTKYKDYYAKLVTIFYFQIDELIKIHECYDLSFRFTTKTRAYKGAGKN